MKRLVLVLALICAATSIFAAEVIDATGRTVVVPDRIERILPAGPPAAVLLTAIAPTQMVGFTGFVSDSARALLPEAAATLPVVPRLTSQQDNTAAVQALHPDLIIDYGAISPRYQQLARETQQKTGIPTLLFDGALDQVPAVARTLGRILHQADQAEAVARFAEAVLALPVPESSHPRVYYARGADGLLAAAPGTEATAVFTRLGWQVVAPDGTGTFRPATTQPIATLDPDIIVLADPAAKGVLASPAWAGLRAVRQGHAMIAPAEPFGWVEEPPSINRLLGLAWLRGSDPATLAGLFNAIVYRRVLTTEQIHAVIGSPP